MSFSIKPVKFKTKNVDVIDCGNCINCTLVTIKEFLEEPIKENEIIIKKIENCISFMESNKNKDNNQEVQNIKVKLQEIEDLIFFGNYDDVWIKVETLQLQNQDAENKSRETNAKILTKKGKTG